MNATKQKIDQLLAELRAQKQATDQKLEKALQRRESIAYMPLPRKEVVDSFAKAVDSSADRFERTLLSIVQRRARKRNATGLDGNPDVIRNLGSYHELNIDAINFFLGDIIKARLNEFVNTCEFFGVDDGIAEIDYKEQLAEVDSEIDRLKADQQELSEELGSILR